MGPLNIFDSERVNATLSGILDNKRICQTGGGTEIHSHGLRCCCCCFHLCSGQCLIVNSPNVRKETERIPEGEGSIEAGQEGGVENDAGIKEQQEARRITRIK